MTTDVQKIYRDALASGDHASALNAVYAAGVVDGQLLAATPPVLSPGALDRLAADVAALQEGAATDGEGKTPPA